MATRQFDIIRRFIMDFPERYKDISPTKTELKVLEIVKRGDRVCPISATDVGVILEVQASAANAHLLNLYNKGYLKHRVETVGVGGQENRYWVRPALKGEV